MSSWNQVRGRVTAAGNVYDVVRRHYLADLHARTGRNVILYYSGWLQKPYLKGSDINDEDKMGLIAAVNQLDRSLGLDLVLHTPGGEAAPTESIVQYLRSTFGTNLRAIVPELAMSGGTMIACACLRIVMSKASSLGPIGPRFGGIPAQVVVEEFQHALAEVKANPGSIPIWQAVVAKHGISFGECRKAIDWCNHMTRDWLESGMFAGEPDAVIKAAAIVKELADQAITMSHSRHLPIEQCRAIGLKVDPLEEDRELQECVMLVHHACILTLLETAAYKLIENQRGVAYIRMAH